MSAPGSRDRRAAADAGPVRVILIGVSLLFLTLFLFLPVANVAASYARHHLRRAA